MLVLRVIVMELDVKAALTVQRLIAAGFTEVGCWELNSARDLVHQVTLPTEAGVYAFAIDGIVQYVGLASKSLRQRLGFYRKPGASQRTNLRLNEIIRGHLGSGTVVQILIGHPPDHDWKGLRIKGAEGLEAGLIEEFDLPWNVRGSTTRTAFPSRLAMASPERQKGVANQILDLVQRRPGMTELEIAKAIHGPGAVQQQVNQYCRMLVNQGKIMRSGSGGQSDPFVYRVRS